MTHTEVKYNGQIADNKFVAIDSSLIRFSKKNENLWSIDIGVPIFKVLSVQRSKNREENIILHVTVDNGKNFLHKSVDIYRHKDFMIADRSFSSKFSKPASLVSILEDKKYSKFHLPLNQTNHKDSEFLSYLSPEPHDSDSWTDYFSDYSKSLLKQFKKNILPFLFMFLLFAYTECFKKKKHVRKASSERSSSVSYSTPNSSVDRHDPAIIKTVLKSSFLSQSSTKSNSDGSPEKSEIGKLQYYPNQILGVGSMGTTVYKGLFHSRNIAVKRILGHYNDFALTEIENLMKADSHSNIVRYYDMEEDDDFMYIALEECAGSIEDFIRMSANGGKPVEVDDSVNS